MTDNDISWTTRIIKVANEDMQIEISPDGDSLGLVEIKAREQGKEIYANIRIPKSFALRVANAITEFCNNPDNFDE